MNRESSLHKFFVPGRIEVLGKHTDYAGGRSLLCAVERGFHVMVTPRADAIVTVTDAGTGASDLLALDPDLPWAEYGHWSVYPRVVARRLARNFPRARRGADIVFESSLPPASGLSSSSAFVIAIFLALAAANDLSEQNEYTRVIRNAEDLATYLACMENGSGFNALAGDRGVGTTGGSEDHTAILCCQPGRLSVYSFAPVRFERTVPVPEGYIFAVGSSGVAAQKTGAALEHYNRAAAQAAELLRMWNEATARADRTLAAALESGPDALAQLRATVRAAGDLMLGRLEQFAEESTVLVPAASDALDAGDVQRFGRLVDRSQELAETALGNQVPETIALAREARTAGAVAASAFGAGFGGSVWALVRAQQADEFVQQWSGAYRREFPERAEDARFFITAAGTAATEVHDV